MATKQLWQWRGMNKQGMMCEGALWQETRGQALASLEQQRILPLALRRKTVQNSLWRSRYSGEVIRQLATLLQAGLPLAEGLELLAQQQPHKQWQALLRVLAQELANGVSLSSGLAQWPQVFPPLYLAMIRTGELTGKLERCCFQLAQQQQEQQRLTEKVKKVLRYPIVILTLALALVVAMLFFVLPEFTAIYRTFNTPLPLLTQMVIHLGDALARYWPLAAASFCYSTFSQPAGPAAATLAAVKAKIISRDSNSGSADQRSATEPDIYHSFTDPKRGYKLCPGAGERRGNRGLPAVAAADCTGARSRLSMANQSGRR